jgi:hypothetical protein
MSEANAARLYRAFFGFDPASEDIVTIIPKRTVALRVGTLDGIIYRIDGERTPLIHRFKSTDRPLLYVSSDGRQLYSVRGRYRFTEAGFVG